MKISKTPVWGWEQLNQTEKHKQRKSQTFKYCETFINYKMPYETFGKLDNNEENLNHEHLKQCMHFFETGFPTEACLFDQG